MELSDRFVQQLLRCVDKEIERKSLPELTVAYNRMYPPSKIGKIFGTERRDYEVERALAFLVQQGLISMEVLTFTDRPVSPNKYYGITRAGIQLLNRRR